MTKDSWVQQFAGAITVCNAQGTILEMNDKAVQSFQEQGGRALIGTDVLHCHPEPARTRLQRMLKTQQANVYTVEKRGVKKLIYQTPWYKDGQYAGFIELVLEIPAETPHFLRDG